MRSSPVGPAAGGERIDRRWAPETLTSKQRRRPMFRIIGNEQVAVTADELQQLIEAGDLGPDVEVRREADGQVFKLGSSPLFADFFPGQGQGQQPPGAAPPAGG